MCLAVFYHDLLIQLGYHRLHIPQRWLSCLVLIVLDPDLTKIGLHRDCVLHRHQTDLDVVGHNLASKYRLEHWLRFPKGYRFRQLRVPSYHHHARADVYV